MQEPTALMPCGDILTQHPIQCPKNGQEVDENHVITVVGQNPTVKLFSDWSNSKTVEDEQTCEDDAPPTMNIVQSCLFLAVVAASFRSIEAHKTKLSSISSSSESHAAIPIALFVLRHHSSLAS